MTRPVPGEGETPKARIDRELIELLNEIRVALPGVEVLFAFLLTLPFTSGWEQVDGSHRDVYFAAVVCTALAIALLIAPSAHHRLRFRDPIKEQMLKTSTTLVIAGLVMIAAAISLILYVIVDVLWSSAVAATIAAVFGLFVAVLWFVVPWFYRRPDPGT